MVGAREMNKHMVIEIICISGMLMLILMGGAAGEDVRSDMDASTKIGCGVREYSVPVHRDLGMGGLKDLGENKAGMGEDIHMPAHRKEIGIFLYGTVIGAFGLYLMAQLPILKYYILL